MKLNYANISDIDVYEKYSLIPKIIIENYDENSTYDFEKEKEITMEKIKYRCIVDKNAYTGSTSENNSEFAINSCYNLINRTFSEEEKQLLINRVLLDKTKLDNGEIKIHEFNPQKYIKTNEFNIDNNSSCFYEPMINTGNKKPCAEGGSQSENENKVNMELNLLLFNYLKNKIIFLINNNQILKKIFNEDFGDAIYNSINSNITNDLISNKVRFSFEILNKLGMSIVEGFDPNENEEAKKIIQDASVELIQNCNIPIDVLQNKLSLVKNYVSNYGTDTQLASYNNDLTNCPEILDKLVEDLLEVKSKTDLISVEQEDENIAIDSIQSSIKDVSNDSIISELTSFLKTISDFKDNYNKINETYGNSFFNNSNLNTVESNESTTNGESITTDEVNFAYKKKLSMTKNDEFNSIDIKVEDIKQPEIIIIGNTSVTLEKDTQFIDKGAITFDFKNDQSKPLNINPVGVVDSSKIGVYEINYPLNYQITRSIVNGAQVTNSLIDNNVTATRTINIIDTKGPVIEIIGDKNISIPLNSNYVDQGASSASGEEVFVSNKVDTTKLGIYEVEYRSTDENNNTTIEKRIVSVIDNIAPTITLKGDPVVNILKGTPFIDPGVEISDGNVQVNGTVDTNVVNTYTINYVANDEYNNISIATRVVNVLDSLENSNTNILTDMNEFEEEEDDGGGLSNKLFLLLLLLVSLYMICIGY